MKEKREPLPKNWELENGLLYFQNRLFIQSDEDFLTEIAKGFHNSRVTGYFRQEKIIELVTRPFYREKLVMGGVIF